MPAGKLLEISLQHQAMLVRLCVVTPHIPGRRVSAEERLSGGGGSGGGGGGGVWTNADSFREGVDIDGACRRIQQPHPEWACLFNEQSSCSVANA